MKREKGSLIALGVLLVFIIIIIIIVYNNINFNSTKNIILKKGYYTNAYIYEEFIGTKTVRDFKFKYFVNDYEYTKRAAIVSMDFFNEHHIGDTIIIKFLPSSPEKSIIIEDIEYKSCMGLPPEEGWKELPKCE